MDYAEYNEKAKRAILTGRTVEIGLASCEYRKPNIEPCHLSQEDEDSKRELSAWTELLKTTPLMVEKYKGCLI